MNAAATRIGFIAFFSPFIYIFYFFFLYPRTLIIDGTNLSRELTGRDGQNRVVLSRPPIIASYLPVRKTPCTERRYGEKFAAIIHRAVPHTIAFRFGRKQLFENTDANASFDIIAGHQVSREPRPAPWRTIRGLITHPSKTLSR